LCYSAWGLDADLQDNPLMPRNEKGSISPAHSQANESWRLHQRPSTPSSDAVSSERSGQSTTFADEKAVFCKTGSRRSITLLPSGINAPRREISLKFHSLDEPPPTRAFISWEIGPCLVLRESIEIRTSALKEMNALAHRSLLLSGYSSTVS
jgi:hypothetical protein